jgi:hypothetical protein
MHDLLITTTRPDLAAKRRRQLKRRRDLISAAVSLPPDLYEAALVQAALHYECNFSRYIRHLIKSDLATA